MIDSRNQPMDTRLVSQPSFAPDQASRVFVQQGGSQNPNDNQWASQTFPQKNQSSASSRASSQGRGKGQFDINSQVPVTQVEPPREVIYSSTAQSQLGQTFPQKNQSSTSSRASSQTRNKVQFDLNNQGISNQGSLNYLDSQASHTEYQEQSDADRQPRTLRSPQHTLQGLSQPISKSRLSDPSLTSESEPQFPTPSIKPQHRRNSPSPNSKNNFPMPFNDPTQTAYPE